VSALRRVIRLGRSGRGKLALAVLLGTLAASAAIGLSGTAAWLISRASQHPPVLHLMVAIVAVRTFGLARGLLRYGERLTGHDASFRILGDLRVATVERLERVVPTRSATDGRTLSTGDLLARFVADVDGLQDVWVRVLLPYASSALVGLATVTLVMFLSPAAGVALALSLVAAAVLAPWVSARAARGAGARTAPLRADYQSQVLDLLAGSTELAVYGAIESRLADIDHLDQAMTSAEARTATSAGVGAAIATAAAGAATWAGLWFGAGAVDSRTLAAVSLAVVVLVPLAVHEHFAALTTAAHQLPALASSAGRVEEIFQLPDAINEPDHLVDAPAGPFGLRISGLHARWGDDGPDVLRGIDIEIPAGSCTLLVGPSGSGKSTLAAVALRLLDPTGGTVELVGSAGAVDITHMDSDDVRRVVGWCAQDAYIFDSTIEANLLLARPEATPADLDRALRAARLDTWVHSLPKGLHTLVGEHGSSLSGGQRQRLALARVVLADSPIVIFDEPTEHLDETIATALATDLLSATAGKTVIVVTHRPELFPEFDHRADLHDGQLLRR